MTDLLGSPEHVAPGPPPKRINVNAVAAEVIETTDAAVAGKISWIDRNAVVSLQVAEFIQTNVNFPGLDRATQAILGLPKDCQRAVVDLIALCLRHARTRSPRCSEVRGNCWQWRWAARWSPAT